MNAGRRTRVLVAAPLAALVVVGTVFVTAGAAFADTSVGDVGLCIGPPAAGGCDSGGGGVTHALPGSTQDLAVTFTATNGLEAGKYISINSNADGPNYVTMSSTDADYSVENVTTSQSCGLDASIVQYNFYSVFVPMPAACAPASGDQIIVHLDNAVMPDYLGAITLAVSTQDDGQDVATNALTLEEPPLPPQSPAMSGGAGSFTVTWSAPSSNGGSDITGYALYCSMSAIDTGGTPTATTDASTFEATVTGLTSGDHWYCVVTASNAVGQSDPSDTVDAVVPGVPGRPKNVYATVGDGSLTIFWTKPATGGTRITHYLVYCSTTKPVVIDPSNLCKPTRGSATSTTLTGLTNNTPYYVRVVAENAIGDSPPSAAIAAVPSKPPSRPRALQATPLTGALSFTWKPPKYDYGMPVQGYFVTCATQPDFSDSVYVESNTNEAELDGLTSGTLYYCVVNAFNGNGQFSQDSLEITATPS